MLAQGPEPSGSGSRSSTLAWVLAGCAACAELALVLLVWWWQSQVVTKQKESLGRFTGKNPALGHTSLLCLCDLVLPCPEPALQVPSA